MAGDLGFEVMLNCSFPVALDLVTEALRGQGFGILTQINVHTIFKEKLGHEFRPYTIIGACNPALAYRSLSAEPAIGLFLPCNIVVEEDGLDRTLVRISNPAAELVLGNLGENPEVREAIKEACVKLEQVAQALLMKELPLDLSHAS